MKNKKSRVQWPDFVDCHTYDASISFNQDDPHDPFWRAFIFLPVLALFQRKGWSVDFDPDIQKNYPSLSKNRRIARKGNLEAHIEIAGRSMSVEFNTTEGVPENPAGHKYGFDKYKKMSRIDQRRFKLIRRDLISLIEKKCEVRLSKRAEANGSWSRMTALEKIEHGYSTSWHSKKELGRPEASPYNSKSRDGKVIEHGATVWAIDYRSKRIVRGTAMVNINNMWWVVLNKHEYRNIASFDIWVDQPADLRRKRNDRERRIRLEKKLALATQRMDFATAEKMKRLIFAGQGIFLIWSRKRSAYYGSQYCGYTGDKISAGKYLKCEAEAECRRVPHNLSMVTPEGKYVRFDQEGSE